MQLDSGPAHEKGQPGLVRAALSGLCPQCGATTLFEAPARIALECSSCGLKLAELERGARLAGLLTILTAAVLIAIALWIETTFRPSIVLHMVIWAPVTVVTVIGVLRLFKTALLYRQYDLKFGDQQGSE